MADPPAVLARQWHAYIPAVVFSLLSPIAAPLLATPILILVVAWIGVQDSFRQVHALLFLSHLFALLSYMPLVLLNAAFWKLGRSRMTLTRFLIIAAILNGMAHALLIGAVLSHNDFKHWD